jgi:hypothetical protein
MVAWTKEHEDAEKDLTEDLFEYLAKNDAKNLVRAAKHSTSSVEKKFMKFGKGLLDVAVETLPGGVAKGLKDSIDAMLTAAYGGAKTHTESCKSESEPYNYVANFFADVLRGKATKEQYRLLAKWYVAMAAAVGAGPAGGVASGAIPGIAEPAAEGAGNAFGWLFEQAGDFVAHEIASHFPRKSKAAKEGAKDFKDIKDLKVGPLAWAVYLSGQPRNPKGYTSTVENCRLALRLILGMPLGETTLCREGGRFQAHPTKWDVVNPLNRCQLLTDKGNFKKNTMISGDGKYNYEKLRIFDEYGYTFSDDKGYKNFKPDPKNDKIVRHIAYLQFILVGLGHEECLTKDKFVLKDK